MSKFKLEDYKAGVGAVIRPPERVLEMTDLFKPEDFKSFGSAYTHMSVQASDIANKKFTQWRESLPLVTGCTEETLLEGRVTVWGHKQQKEDTHRARIAFIEPIRRAECEHEPRGIIDILTSGTIHSTFSLCQMVVCAKCGVKLKATWSPAEEAK